jgi:glutaredoxin 3
MSDPNTATAGNRPLIEIYHKTWCPYSRAALALLDRKGVAYRDIDVTDDRVREREMIDRAGRHTVPQIFVDGAPIGGFDDLARRDREGTLDGLLHGRQKAA